MEMNLKYNTILIVQSIYYVINYVNFISNYKNNDLIKL